MSKENEKTKNLLEKAFRRKQGIIDRLLCMRLIQGTFSCDIKSIITNTCMAASMVEEGYPDKLEGFDFEKFRIMKQIDSNLQKTEFRRLPVTVKKFHYHEIVNYKICPIPWSIPQTEEIYEKCIKPWKPTLTYREEGIKRNKAWLIEIIHSEYENYRRLGRGCGKRIDVVYPEIAKKKMKEWIGKTCPECKKKIERGVLISNKALCVIPEPHWSYFFEVSQCLDHSGFKKLSSAFYEWARDECGKAIMIMGSLVSQNIYDDVLKQLKMKPEEPEEH